MKRTIMRSGLTRFALSAASGVLLASASAIALHAQTLSPSINQYGTTGLIDMPSAESQPDAQLSTTLGGFAGFTRATFTFQVLPRLSGSFRYSKIPNWFRGEDTYDRSFDFQYRVFDEGKIRPALAIGLRDFMGTGIYSGQYVVATKNLGPKLKATAGLGWGRFSDSNQAQIISFGLGGRPNTSDWFTGPVGGFGGLEWQTPVKGLRAKIEYSADRYTRENDLSVNRTEATFVRRSPLNFGVEYKTRGGFKYALSYMYGSQIGLSFTTALNPRKGNGHREAAPLPLAVRSQPYDPDTSWVSANGIEAAAVKQLNDILKPDGLQIESLSFSAKHAELRLRNNRYLAVSQAIGRTARAMASVFPDTVESFTIVPVEKGLATSAITLQRSDLEELEHHPDGNSLIAERSDIVDAGPRPIGSTVSDELYPRFSWSFRPYATLVIFDAASPFDFNAGLRLSGHYDVAPGLSFNGSIKKNLVGSLADSGVRGPSGLYRVRTNQKSYREQGDPALESLTADYLFKLRPDTYGRISVGYLEPMYGGVSAEVLWKPAEKKWGLGAEINHVKQRDFNQRFGFQNYSVTTGHVSAYFELPRDFEAQVDVGRYLAGDVGTTLTVDRTFSNGWRIGAYATFTNVSAQDFGEGSFDKGIQLVVPLGWALGTASKRKVGNRLASLTRDGGAKLSVHNRLFNIVQDSHQSKLSGAWGRFWR